MIKSLEKNRAFLIGYILLILPLFILELFLNKGSFNLWFNQYKTEFIDLFFVGVTYLGDGIFTLFIAFVYLLFGKNKKLGLLLLLAFAVQGLTVLFLKNIVFNDIQRPAVFFEGTGMLEFVPYIDIHRNNSFPSGHSATAFMLCLWVASLFNRGMIKIFCLILACTIGFSRVYLHQHFMIDVCVGSFIGILSFYIAYGLMYKYLKKQNG